MVEPGEDKAYFEGFERDFVAVEGGKLSFLRRAGHGLPVVLIPGSFSDARQWVDVVGLLPENMPLVLVELRGHGGSWPPTMNGSIELFAADVIRIVDRLELKEYAVGGHSIGGMVAIEVARLRPGSVRVVISIEGWTNHRAAKDAFGGDMRNTLTPEQEARRVAERERVTAKWSEEQFRHFGTCWRQWCGHDFLCETDVPVLEVYGDRGKAKPTLAALGIPDKPSIEVRWVEGASHSLPLERPDAVAEAIRGCWARVGR